MTPLHSPSMKIEKVIPGIPPDRTILITNLTQPSTSSTSQEFESTLAGLSSGTLYYFRARFCNRISCGKRTSSTPESIMTHNVAPGAPQSVQLVSSSSTSITIAWTPPEDNGGASVSGYEVWISDWMSGVGDTSRNPAPFRKVHDRPNNAETTQETLDVNEDSIVTDYRYIFKVRAINFCIPSNITQACYGEFSGPALYAVRSPVAPEAPSVLEKDSRTSVVAKRICINWKPPKHNDGAPITQYRVYMNDNALSITGCTLLSLTGPFPHDFTHSVENLEPDHPYRYKIRAVNAIGMSEESPVLSVVLANVPPALLPPEVFEISSHSIRLRWQPSGTCSSSRTGCNGSSLLEYKLYQFTTITSELTPSQSAVMPEIQRVSTTCDPPQP